MTLQLLVFSPMKSAVKPLILVALLLTEGGLWAELLGTPLPKGLPRGLERPHGVLKELSLPPSVDRLDWVPDHIEILNASGTNILHLKGLPSSLRELDVSYTDIQSLDSVPQNLSALDIRETQINHLAGLPPKLESLKVANRNIYRLGKLPTSLRELHLENTRISDLTGLPPRLQSLYFEGENLKNLDGIPETLQSLTLVGTKVRSLKSLPPSLQRLELTANRSLRFQASDLPALLTWLTVDHEQPPSPGLDLSSLKYLTWYSDRRASPNPSFPPFLSSLTLRVPTWTDLPKLPRSLRALGLLNAGITPLENLPPELEILDLTGYSKPETGSLRYLTCLKRLEIDYSSVVKLPELPDQLESLVLTRTKIRDLRNLPRKLMAISFCESDLERLDGRHELPSSLKRLDLCKSRSFTNLSSVPYGLTHLNLEGTRVSRLPNLGSSLQELDVSNTKIERLDLRSLPRNLKALTVSVGQLDNLADLPSEVKTLRIVRVE